MSISNNKENNPFINIFLEKAIHKHLLLWMFL